MTSDAPRRPTEMDKAYEHQQVERRLYAWWEASNFFAPRADAPRPPFVIAIPPPNVTGELHLGHAMFVTIEDLMIRWRRMQGYQTLWVPGTDHAGIATQSQVERLLRSEGSSRQEVGRTEFLRRTWEWKEKYGGEITNQLRRMGASCDWSRERFTLDAGLSRAVHTAFKRLYDDGLIYRGRYLVNWSPALQTAVSDLEVEYEQRNVSIWYVRYPLLDAHWSGPQAAWGSGRWAEGATSWLTVATTRPETILGDTAVAVAPDDERYHHLHGRYAMLPALGRQIPIIADAYVDKEFGSGAVKITPAHDKNDYEVGRRHQLPMINILNKDATLNAEAGPYAGLDRFEARKAILADLEREGLLVKVEPHTMNVGISQRGREIIEPLLSEQWFVRMRPLADMALAAVREGRTRIIPERFEKVYFHWLEHIDDWCISRQLWWGHRIPVWYLPDGTMLVPGPDEQPPADAVQDSDVLDTWFSSGLWPFSTLGWPDATADLRTFYPSSVMETGYDILFFWVARMMMMGCYLTGVEPFHTIYLHGLVRDEHGRKMSKSYGNSIGLTESAGEMFGKVMSLGDDVMGAWFRLLTDVPESEVTALLAGHPRTAKARLGEEIASFFHGRDAGRAASEAFDRQFRDRELPSDIPEVTREWPADGVPLAVLLRELGLAPSSSEARRTVEQGGVKLDGKVQRDPKFVVQRPAAPLLIQFGKRKYLRVR